MELIPKWFITGLFTPPPNVPGGPSVTLDKINRVWSEVGPKYGYRQLQTLPDNAGAVFIGAQAEEGVTIQPPLLQVRDPISMTARHSAEKAEEVLKVIARHLGVNQVFNLAVRHVYHVPMEDNDAAGFVMRRVLHKTEDELDQLGVGGNLWAGVKYVAVSDDRQFTLVIEPLQADPKFLFLDLDAQFPGPTTLDALTQRAKDAEQYLSQAVSGYLENAA